MNKEKRGIFAHGRIRAFLTRGLFKNQFRPLLYTVENYIHIEFVKCINASIFQVQPYYSQAEFVDLMGVIVIYPKQLFELLLINDNKFPAIFPRIIRLSENKAGNDVCLATQALYLASIQVLIEINPRHKISRKYDLEKIRSVFSNNGPTRNEKLIEYWDAIYSYHIQMCPIEDMIESYICIICEILMPSKIPISHSDLEISSHELEESKRLFKSHMEYLVK